MTQVLGPDWAVNGLDSSGGRLPLSVEGPVMRAVERLAPGLSSVTRYTRYYALYAALAAHAEHHDLDSQGSRRLVRRAEVILAALSLDTPAETAPGPAHGVDRVRSFCSDGGLELARAAAQKQLQKTYSPREWGFWAQYGGPSAVLGTARLVKGALRPGARPCPPGVRQLFAPVLDLAEHDSITPDQLESARPAALQHPEQPETGWLTDLMTATRSGAHDPGDWEPADRTRRASLRVIARAIALHGAAEPWSVEYLVGSAVAFGPALTDDQVLLTVPQAAGWRGVLLRNYSVNAWRRLWAGLVSGIGSEHGEADRSREELRAWLADQVPQDRSVRAFVQDLPDPWDAHGHPAPAERALLQDADPRDPVTNLKLLLVGAQRGEPGRLSDEVRSIFLGHRRRGGEFLDPTWVLARLQDHWDRPVRDLAAQLADDMLAQSRRVALSKLKIDSSTGTVRTFSRLHQRNERYYKTGDEGDAEIGTRLRQLGSFGIQLGLFERDEDGSWQITPKGSTVLEVRQ
ncbi:hypothetical protein [Kitasatospora sp. NPDC004289]